MPGQVEDDASVLRGAGDVDGNLDLLRTARRLHPTAFLIYKPHPDVEAGLRKGAVAHRATWWTSPIMWRRMPTRRR